MSIGATPDSYTQNTSVNLLGTTARVETPILGVVIGNYVIGIYNDVFDIDENNNYKYKYHINPRFVKSLKVKKINGTVNQYTLVLDYPVTVKDDPNLLDKMFASVSDTRRIRFSYGDASVPAFVYKEEEAIITKVKRRTTPSTAVKRYTVSAVSTGALNVVGSYKFNARNHVKPSDVIYEILYSPKYGLTSLFYGMTDEQLVRAKKLIYDGDEYVDLQEQINISVLDYLSYLVGSMKSASSSKTKLCYLLFDDDVSVLNGPYFRVVASDKYQEKSTAYEIDIGYPSQNIVTDWSVEDDETYAIYYKFSEQLSSYEYVKRIDDDGNWIDVYAPSYAPKGAQATTPEALQSWWRSVTEYPIKASITFKGLLRPAVLMSYVRVRIYFWGQPDMDSGLYIVTSQEDTIDESGFRTTLGLLRVGGDDSYNT